MMSPAEIRIGLICAGTSVPHWQAQAIRRIVSYPGARISVFRISSSEHQGEPNALHARIRRWCRHRLAPLSARPENLSDLLPTESTNLLDLHAEDDDPWSKSGSWGVDVVFSFVPLPLPQQPVPQRGPGVWQFTVNRRTLPWNGLPLHLNSKSADRTIEVSLRDVMRGAQETAEPIAWDERGRPSMDPVLLAASWLPIKVLRRIGLDAVVELNKDLIKETLQPDGQGSMISDILLASRLYFGLLRHENDRRKQVDEWNIGVYHQPIASLLLEEPSLNVRWLSSPSTGNHRLEPFGYQANDGQMNVLYRKKDRLDQIDPIARIRPKSDGVLKRSRTMLSTTASLGYPYVVQHKDGLAYVVISYPHQDRTELFRVSEANDSLDHVNTLIHIALVNPTCFEYRNKWWLFGTADDAPDSVLLAFHADAFEGPYTPHMNNPVKMDGRHNRPAGTPFESGGTLWRPASDPTRAEGPGLVFHRVLRLDEEGFEESAERSFPGFIGTTYGNGIRTVCAMGDLTLVDGLRSIRPETSRPHGKHRSHRKHHRSSEE